MHAQLTAGSASLSPLSIRRAAAGVPFAMAIVSLIVVVALDGEMKSSEATGQPTLATLVCRPSPARMPAQPAALKTRRRP